MPYEDLSRALAQCESIRQFIIHNPGGREHTSALTQIRELLASADAAVEDYECKRLVRLIEHAASELFSAIEHEKWARGQTSGADVLRLQILRDLDAFKNRLTTIEAMRSSTGQQRSAVLTRLNKT